MNAKDSDAAVNVHLDSEGGSVDSAIEIGRFLRDKNSNVMVSAGEQCASACLFILAGGVTRYLGGRLGMHRPFLETPSRSMTTEDVKKADPNSPMMVEWNKKFQEDFTAAPEV